jgi:hypothetical protein
MQVIDHLHRRERQAAHEASLIDQFERRTMQCLRLEPRRGAVVSPALSANRGRLKAGSIRIVSAARYVISSGSGSTDRTTIVAPTIIGSPVTGTTVHVAAIYTGLPNGNST